MLRVLRPSRRVYVIVASVTDWMLIIETKTLFINQKKNTKKRNKFMKLLYFVLLHFVAESYYILHYIFITFCGEIYYILCQLLRFVALHPGL